MTTPAPPTPADLGGTKQHDAAAPAPQEQQKKFTKKTASVALANFAMKKMDNESRAHFLFSYLNYMTPNDLYALWKEELLKCSSKKMQLSLFDFLSLWIEQYPQDLTAHQQHEARALMNDINSPELERIRRIMIDPSSALIDNPPAPPSPSSAAAAAASPSPSSLAANVTTSWKMRRRSTGFRLGEIPEGKEKGFARKDRIVRSNSKDNSGSEAEGDGSEETGSECDTDCSESEDCAYDYSSDSEGIAGHSAHHRVCKQSSSSSSSSKSQSTAKKQKRKRVNSLGKLGRRFSLGSVGSTQATSMPASSSSFSSSSPALLSANNNSNSNHHHHRKLTKEEKEREKAMKRRRKAAKKMRKHLAQEGIDLSTLDNNAADDRSDHASNADLDNALFLLSLDSLEIARELTMSEFLLFRAVKAREFLNGGWQKDNRHQVAPNLTRVIERFNEVSYWAATLVLKQKDRRVKALVMRKLIDVAKRCKQLNNFNSLAELVSGLSNGSVSRLKDAWELVGEKAAKTFAKLEELMQPQQNFINYRQELQRLKREMSGALSLGGASDPGGEPLSVRGGGSARRPPALHSPHSSDSLPAPLRRRSSSSSSLASSSHLQVLPYVALFLRDLTFMREGNRSYNPDGSINFQLMELEHGLVNEVRFFQSRSYLLPRNKDVRQFFQQLDFVDDEDELYRMSIEASPPVGHTWSPKPVVVPDDKEKEKETSKKEAQKHGTGDNKADPDPESSAHAGSEEQRETPAPRETPYLNVTRDRSSSFMFYEALGDGSRSMLKSLLEEEMRKREMRRRDENRLPHPNKEAAIVPKKGSRSAMPNRHASSANVHDHNDTHDDKTPLPKISSFVGTHRGCTATTNKEKRASAPPVLKISSKKKRVHSSSTNVRDGSDAAALYGMKLSKRSVSDDTKLFVPGEELDEEEEEEDGGGQEEKEEEIEESKRDDEDEMGKGRSQANGAHRSFVSKIKTMHREEHARSYPKSPRMPKKKREVVGAFPASKSSSSEL